MRADVEQALQLIHSNQSSSVEQALGLLQNTVFSFSMKVCGHPQDAEDTMQDVLLESIPYLPKFENAQALSVWLYKVARNRCLMNRRGMKFSLRPCAVSPADPREAHHARRTGFPALGARFVDTRCAVRSQS